MTSNTEQLTIEADRHFFELRNRVRRRLDPDNSLDWLLQDNHNNAYQPDYLTMSSAGKSRFEQRLNRLVSIWLPELWFRVFWPKISGKLIAYTKEKYYAKIFREIGDASQIQEIKLLILSLLRRVLSENWSDLRQCTFTELSNCLLEIIHLPFSQLPVEQDIFLSDKIRQNRECLNLLKEISQALRSSDRRLETLIYLASRSNWIDSLEDDVENQLETFLKEIRGHWNGAGLDRYVSADPRFYQVKETMEILQSTKGPILYEFDNCGELVFDLCLIEALIDLKRPVYLGVKACPVVNDVMEKDIRAILEDEQFLELKAALDKGLLRFVSPGCFKGGGKLVHEVSEQYRDAYAQSELLIIKGQGNFQSMPMARSEGSKPVWFRYRKPIVYMTGVRADMIDMCLSTVYSEKNKPRRNHIFLHVYPNSS